MTIPSAALRLLRSALDAGQRPGHFGLIGMRERAKKLGAHLEVWSKPGAGTEVDLRIPADVAYKRSQSEQRGIATWLGRFVSSRVRGSSS